MMKHKMKIAIVGAGGVGGYLAGKLQHKALSDITLIARGKQLSTIKESGLHIIDTDNAFTTYPKVKESCTQTEFDVVFITTKSYDFPSACASIDKCIGEDTLVIPLSNGVDHAHELKKYLPKCILCEGCVYIISHLVKPGSIEKKSPLFYLLFGSQVDAPQAKDLEKLLNQSDLKAKYSTKISYDCWKKYLFIASFGTLTSYYKLCMNNVMQNHKADVLAVLDEIKKVANAKQIPIDDEDIAKVLKQANNLPSNSKTSMQLDFEKNRKTELESLSGYIVEEALKLNLKVPVMQKMYTKLLQVGV